MRKKVFVLILLLGFILSLGYWGKGNWCKEKKDYKKKDFIIEILVPQEVVLVKLTRFPLYLDSTNVFAKAISEVGEKYKIKNGIPIIATHPGFGGDRTASIILFVEPRKTKATKGGGKNEY